MKTTLNRIRERRPCVGGWEKLLRYLNKTRSDDEPLAITTILDSNGVDDALWCLRAVEGHDRDIRLLAVAYARRMQHLMTDPRSLAALDVAERHALGAATDDELQSAWEAAREAAAVAAWAADAAWAAAAAVAASADADAAAAEAAAVAAAVAARAEALDAELRWQETELRRVCAEIEARGVTR